MLIIAFTTETVSYTHLSPQEDLASGVTIGQKEQEDMPEQQVLASSEEPYENLCYIGEIFHTYILFEGENRLVVVDKHAAHERILYNRLKRGKPEQFMQNLLLPISVLLSQEEYSAALEHLDVLLECGFEIEDFGGRSLLVLSLIHI